MVLTLPDGKTSVSGSASSIMKTVASLAPASGLVGHGDAEETEIDSWVTYGQTNIEVPVAAMKAAGTKIDSAVMDSIKKDMDHTISVLNCHVMPKKYMVGDSFTVADIAIACALKDAAKLKLFDPSSNDEKTEHICRWFKTVTSDSCFDVKVNAEDEGAPAGESSTAGVSLHGAAPVVQNKLYKRNRIRIKEVLNDPTLIGKTITIAGWTRTLRKAGGKLMFIELNDGSCGTSIQCTFQAETTEGFDDAKGCGGTGSSFQLTGEVIESPAAGQAVELKVTVSKLLGAVYGGDAKGETVGGMLYPMSKKGHTLEHMRDNAHLRPRAGLHAAAMRVRHAMAYATHKFFHDHGFLYIHTPIITCADCEGAGEQFGVTTMLGSDHHKPGIELKVYKEKPVEEAKPLSKSEQKRLAKQAAKNAGKSKEESMKPEHKEVPGAVDYTDDFFSKRANLTVSGQLNVETHACALSDVYTFGPTFRAENSHTSRHLSEFWMIEPEIAFADLQDDINLAEDYLKYCVQYALEMCSEDLEFFENSPFGEVGLRARLKNVLENPFKVSTTLLSPSLTAHVMTIKPSMGISLKFLCMRMYGRRLDTYAER
jgi:aspartyl/asparaginyl-tRNA synthetase/glutathione S-transferase